MKYALKEIEKEIASNMVKDIDHTALSRALDIRHNQALLKLWKKANYYGEFISMIDKDENLKYHEDVVSIRRKDWYYRRGYCGKFGKVFKTYSEQGSLRIVNEHFSMLFANGYGDGMNRVAILPWSKLTDVSRLFPRFLGIVEGAGLVVHINDWQKEKQAEDYALGEGKFWIYGDERFFAIVKEEL